MQKWLKTRNAITNPTANIQLGLRFVILSSSIPLCEQKKSSPEKIRWQDLPWFADNRFHRLCLFRRCFDCVKLLLRGNVKHAVGGYRCAGYWAVQLS